MFSGFLWNTFIILLILKLSYLWHGRVLCTGSSVFTTLSSEWQLLSSWEGLPFHQKQQSQKSTPLHGSRSPLKAITHTLLQWNNALLTARRDRARWVSRVDIGFLWPAGHLPHLTHSDDLQGPLLCVGWRILFLPLHSTTPMKECSSGWQGAIWYTCSNRTKEHVLSLKQRKMFPHRLGGLLITW